AAGTGEENYETSSANGGAVHKIITNEDDMVTLKIGASVDDELDGQPSDDADGDGADDDGFDPTSVMFVRGQSEDLTIPVMNMTGGPAKLTVYIDWNNDGVFDGTDEMYFTTVADQSTSAILAGITPPTGASINDEIGMRFRLTTDMTMSPTGPAPDGEVEDYEIMVMAFDYGDLVDGAAGTGEEDYETSSANGGPVHKIITNEDDMVTLKIGDTIDDELDGQPSADATGDGDDEDGFDPTSVMFVTGQSVDLDIPVMNMTGAPAKLTVFIDWNNNGDFTDMGEMYFVDVPDQAASVTIADIVPPFTTTLNDEIGFRIRLSSDMDASMSPTGPAPDGEVEDYEIMVMGFDYGDLIDGTAGTAEQDYQTQSANGGPSHKIITNEDDMVLLKIGSLLDDEADGQQSSNATGDVTDEDDEDGFDPMSIMFMTNQSVDIDIPVMNMTGSEAKLVFYIDWNNDGEFGPDEMYSAQVPDQATTVTLVGVTPPLTATLNDDIGIRIRLSTDQDAVMSPYGPAPDGEVEDYEIPVMGFDYGDLNDVVAGTNGDANAPLTPADYQTTAADNGPAHKILTNDLDEVLLKIGNSVDDEVDGQPSADAGATGGDDNNAAAGTMDADDEDGLDMNNLPVFILTQTTTLDIPVMNMTGTEATIAVYVDFNKDGFLDPATEKFTAPVADGATNVTVSVGPIPATSVVGQDLGLRIRLANEMAEVMTSTGIANSGEVEDYMIQIIGFDYGDLPDTYTTTGPEAPRHIVSEDLKLGSCVDTEIDGIPEAMAGMMQGGDDADPGLFTFGTCTDGSDEDGIVFSHPFIPGNESCITVSAMNMTGEDAVLQVWIDWNGDGMFGAGEELVFNDAIVPPGGVDGAEYCFPVPTVVGYSEGSLFIRARLSPDGGLTPDSQTGVVPFGEIEDYKVKLSKVGSLVWEDYNGNGVQDEAGDLGINGVDVELLWFGPDGDVNTTDDNRTYTVTTGNDGTTDGIYSFCGLNPGTYSISIPTLPGDYVPTWSDIPGDDVIDSDDHAGVEFTIVDPMGLPEGENGTGDNPGGINGFPDMQDDLSFDFGAYIPAELGDYVWLDESYENNDDTQVSTGAVPDLPIEGVTVTLMGTNNVGQPVMLVLTTDENGYYKFEDLAPGSYKVIFDASTALGECGPILLAVAQNSPNGDDTTDSDQNAGFVTPFYDLFSGDDIETVDGGFVEPPIELGCIANLNVTLDANCSATITEDMILTGLYGCVDEFIITVDGTDSNVLYGCGEHTYMIQIVEDGEIVYTCWGTIFAEDKTDPVIDCPDDTDSVTQDYDAYQATGTLEASDATYNFNEHSCLTQVWLVDGEHNYDVLTFTTPDFATPVDIYTIVANTQWGDGSLFLFDGDFDPASPCENIIGSSDDNGLAPNSPFDPSLRMSLPLSPNTTYTLVLTNWLTTQLGDWDITIYSDENVGLIDGDFTAVSIEETRDLVCNDINNILFETPQSWIADAAGTLDFNATRDAFFGGSTAALNAFIAKLGLTGFPVVGDNCGPVLVTLSDVTDADGDCGEERITRTFTVSDRYDGVCIGAPRTATCDQVITFRKPTIGDLVFPSTVALVGCDEDYAVDANGNPHPSRTGYPWLRTAFGFEDLDEIYCNIGASYSDEPRIDVCEGTYKLRREWNIIDWCNPGGSGTIDQLIKVG
ncbi:MAG: GEVED domain-containing protein, partial [Lewinella sp.]|uniref:GEVED domain-containing protein n=1 Tax=Lewinella sp. TaxID=2004506 RepID=UPI003D6A0A87